MHWNSNVWMLLGSWFFQKICRLKKDIWIASAFGFRLYALRTIVRIPRNDALKIRIIDEHLLMVAQVVFEFIRRYEFECFSCTRSLEWIYFFFSKIILLYVQFAIITNDLYFRFNTVNVRIIEVCYAEGIRTEFVIV